MAFMEIRSEGRNIEYKQSMFPDGQVHLKLAEPLYDSKVAIITPLQHALDFVELLLLKEILDHGDNETSLLITYMGGARMDRRIDDAQPFSLKVFAKLVSDAGFKHIGVLDPHSDVTTALLDAEAFYPAASVSKILSLPRFEKAVVIAPDAGATKRVDTILGMVHERTGLTFPVVQGLKHRDMQTGRLSGFSISSPNDVVGKPCIILDDICDGGGTFIGLADVLRKAGATQVDLFVTHGIFSKGTVLKGIDYIYTTDSLGGRKQEKHFRVYPLSEEYV